MLYYVYNTTNDGKGDTMLIEIDFNSDEALYVQLQNQIIMGIAMDIIREGDALPSVRQMADTVGINMHTVNKAYSVLRQEGFFRKEEPMALSMEVSPRPEEDADIVLANTKRVIKRAWALLEDEPE